MSWLGQETLGEGMKKATRTLRETVAMATKGKQRKLELMTEITEQSLLQY